MLAALTFVMVAATLPPVKGEWWIIEEEKMNNREKVLKIEGVLAAAGATDAFMTAVAVVKCWPELVKIMGERTVRAGDYDSAKTWPNQEGTPQERLEARRQRVSNRDRTSTQHCECAQVSGVAYHSDATGCEHCADCGGVVSGMPLVHSSTVRQPADFDAENDANEFKRPSKRKLCTCGHAGSQKTLDGVEICLQCYGRKAP